MNWGFLCFHNEKSTHLTKFDPTCQTCSYYVKIGKNWKECTHKISTYSTINSVLILFAHLGDLITHTLVTPLLCQSILFWLSHKGPSFPATWPMLGSSQNPSSWNTSEPSQPPGLVAISFSILAFQGQFHSGDRAASGTGIPALLMFLLATTQDVPLQSRKDSVGQQAESGTGHGIHRSMLPSSPFYLEFILKDFILFISISLPLCTTQCLYQRGSWLMFIK